MGHPTAYATSFRIYIINNCNLSSATPIDATSKVIANKMQYAKRITPNERRMKTVKRKMESEFLASSSNSEDEEGQGATKKEKLMWQRRLTEAHKKMCEKATDTMDSIKM